MPALHILVPLLVLATLCASSFTLVYILEATAEEETRQDALILAQDTGKWFSDQLDQAITPVFSLAQFVHELEIFQDIPKKLGSVHQPGSRPLITDVHRNVSGICDDTETVHRFAKIAASIKENANMQGVLVNLQLAPQGIVCLVHPVVNTEDFPPGLSLDNTRSIGHDLLADPNRQFIAESTLKAEEIVVAGPHKLLQCSDCDPLVEKDFIIRLPIIMDGFNIRGTGGTLYKNRWGFAVAIVNWQVLVQRSKLYEEFQGRGWNFQLTRTDRVLVEGQNEEYEEKVVLLAETPGFANSRQGMVSTSLATTNNEWVMTVAYGYEHSRITKIVALAAAVFVSVFISTLVYIVLLQKQLHNILVLQNLQTAEKAAQAERDLNDFIAHEVRNPISAALSACIFVSTAIEPKKVKKDASESARDDDDDDEELAPLVLDSKAQQTIQEDVNIISSSLRFVNELLRSMLDIHRAASDEMVMDPSPTDIRIDIFVPIASMLYTRDDNFVVEIDCPDSFIVSVDRLRLQQVILNLSRNAVKFVEEGFLRLRAFLSEDACVCLAVEDSGPGIPIAKRAHLFSRFQESLDSLNQGTGVGLNLCKSLVDLMGGDIYLDESYNSGREGCPGARFVVALKGSAILDHEDQGHLAADVMDEQRKSSTKANDRSLLNNADCGDDIEAIHSSLPDELSVLFVDDERILRKLALRSLGKLRPRWTIREAATGEAALQLVETETFDLIFMDQYMTSAERQLTGTETIRAMRARGVNSLICGLSANNLEDAFLKAGATCFITKPFPAKQDELRKFLVETLQT